MQPSISCLTPEVSFAAVGHLLSRKRDSVCILLTRSSLLTMVLSLVSPAKNPPENTCENAWRTRMGSQECNTPTRWTCSIPTSESCYRLLQKRGPDTDSPYDQPPELLAHSRPAPRHCPATCRTPSPSPSSPTPLSDVLDEVAVIPHTPVSRSRPCMEEDDTDG
jgi:hypothetical protein